tara:strand:+ start:273 stop:554 length:282 start_codon:yes stop_codon:yes gene_type:complete
MNIDFLKYWQADEIAECVDTSPYLSKDEARALYVKLWTIAHEQVKLNRTLTEHGDEYGNEAKFYLIDEYLDTYSVLTEKELMAIKLSIQTLEY